MSHKFLVLLILFMIENIRCQVFYKIRSNVEVSAEFTSSMITQLKAISLIECLFSCNYLLTCNLASYGSPNTNTNNCFLFGISNLQNATLFVSSSKNINVYSNGKSMWFFYKINISRI